MAEIIELEGILDYRFSDTALLRQSLVHGSVLNENQAPDTQSNERMEYLGDAVLGLIIAHQLYDMMPSVAEGELTRLRAGLVCRSTLALLAGRINLGEYLFVGKGEEASGGRSKPANLARGLEAVIGAVYLDGGLDKARHVIQHLYGSELEQLALNQACADSKSRLQEFVQARQMGQPTYRIINTEGPVHAPMFTAEVLLNDAPIASGTGRSKKLAESRAAFNALKELENNPA